MMQTVTAEIVVAAAPVETFTAVLGLVRRIWDVADSDVVDLHPPDRLVHGVALDGETVCWLTWEISPVGATATRVKLVHDELDMRSAPKPDVGGVLSMLRSSMLAPAVDEEDAR